MATACFCGAVVRDETRSFLFLIWGCTIYAVRSMRWRYVKVFDIFKLAGCYIRCSNRMRTKQDVSFCWRDLEPYPCWFMIWVWCFRSKIAGITQFDDNAAQQKPSMVWYTKSPFCQDAEDRVGKIMQNSDDVRGIRHDSTLQTLHIWLLVWNMICFPCIYVYIYILGMS